VSRRKKKTKSQTRGNKRPLSSRSQAKKPTPSGSPNPPNSGRTRRSGRAVKDAPPSIETLEQVNVNAAGIDIGASEHYVAVPDDGRDLENCVRSFGAFTADLQAISAWLTECGITTVAMESTGIYWIPLYELLERDGFEVFLVEPSQIKKHRRKTDVLDCQWIQTLHTFGLLSGSFRPDDAVIVLRSYMRQREMLTKHAAMHVQHMQKALEQMNLKLTEVISDVCGVTGMTIIDAILAGERDCVKLAQLRHKLCKNDEDTIALALQGNWRDEHLFSLRQAVDLYRYYHQKMVEVDAQIEAYVTTFEDKSQGDSLPKKPRHQQRSKSKNEPKFATREILHRMTGVDLTAIDSIGEHAALQIISEIGLDMTKWPTEKHFVSWLCLCPEMNKSGGRKQKKGRSRSQPSTSRTAKTLRVCAQTLFRSKDCALGAFARRLRSRDGAPSAITAVARKLAIIIYSMLKYGKPYIDRGAEHYDQKYREKMLRSLRHRADKLGFDLQPQQTA